MLVCWPSIVVVIVSSDETISPLRLHVIVRGLSPLLTTQVSCANFPWSIRSNPKENGTISGFSVNKILSVPSSQIPFTFSSVEYDVTPAGFSALQV